MKPIVKLLICVAKKYTKEPIIQFEAVVREGYKLSDICDCAKRRGVIVDGNSNYIEWIEI